MRLITNASGTTFSTKLLCPPGPRLVRNKRAFEFDQTRERVGAESLSRSGKLCAKDSRLLTRSAAAEPAFVSTCFALVCVVHGTSSAFAANEGTRPRADQLSNSCRRKPKR